MYNEYLSGNKKKGDQIRGSLEKMRSGKTLTMAEAANVTGVGPDRELGLGPEVKKKKKKKASGGYISGPGSKTSDSIPARLSNGEYVVRASSVQKYGKSALDKINEGRFASGGIVGEDSLMGAMASGMNARMSALWLKSVQDVAELAKDNYDMVEMAMADSTYGMYSDDDFGSGTYKEAPKGDMGDMSGGPRDVAGRVLTAANKKGLTKTLAAQDRENKQRQVNPINGNTGSDHSQPWNVAYAVDLGTSYAPGNAMSWMDKFAKEIQEVWGFPTSGQGMPAVERDGYKLQLIWRDSGHYDHIHLGARKLAEGGIVNFAKGGKVASLKKGMQKTPVSNLEQENEGVGNDGLRSFGLPWPEEPEPEAEPESEEKEKKEEENKAGNWESREQEIWGRFKNFGLSDAGVAGIMGNFKRESGYDPTIKQYGGGPGRGLAQWTYSDRWQNLLRWAKAKKLNPNTIEAQVGFTMHEMESSMKDLLKFLKNTDDPLAAADKFQRVFERAGHVAQGERDAEAKKLMKKYGGKTFEGGKYAEGGLAQLMDVVGGVSAPGVYDPKEHELEIGEMPDVVGGDGTWDSATGDAPLKGKPRNFDPMMTANTLRGMQIVEGLWPTTIKLRLSALIGANDPYPTILAVQHSTL